MRVEQGAVIAGKFRLERQIAKGGMGAVWIARHLLLDTDVAIKFIDPERTATEAQHARFLQEAKVSLRIKSPHVVQVLDFGIEDGTPFMVMELLEGEDLSEHLERKGRLSLAEAYAIVEPVGKALRRAHSLGLVHRDLKPSNIFLVHSGDERIVKVLDFGIVKQVLAQNDGGVTSSDAILGSPRYMSPEQVRHTKHVDHRSDLWSLGVILYEALTGRAPFEQESVGALLVSICHDPWSPPSEIVPELGVEVDIFFAQALERVPDGRFQSADEMVEAFALLAGVQPPVRPDAGLLGAPDSSRKVDPLASTITGSPAGSPGSTGRRREPRPKAGGRWATPRSSSVNEGTLLPSSSREPSSPSRGRRAGLLAGAVVLAVVGVGLRSRSRSSDPGAPASPEAPGLMSVAAPPPLTPPPAQAAMNATPATSLDAARTVRVAVEPADAAVEVDGHAASVSGGAVEIRGPVGSVHAVRVRKDERELDAKVVVTESGAVPDRMALAPHTAVRAAPAPHGRRPSSGSGSGSGSSGAPAPGMAGEVPPPAAPPPPPPPPPPSAPGSEVERRFE